MEAKINVAEILKDKPENTKLYSPLFGDVYFSYIKDSIINVKFSKETLMTRNITKGKKSLTMFLMIFIKNAYYDRR